MAIITHDGAVPASAASAFAGMIGAVPGCLLSSLDLITTDRRPDPRPSIQAALSGWSPTLHRVNMRWTTLLPNDWPVDRLSDPDFVPRLARLFGAKIALQRARAAAGIAIGAALPLKATYESTIRYDHLHVDRAAFALSLSGMVAAHRSGTASIIKPLNAVDKTIQPLVFALHRTAEAYLGGPYLKNNGHLAEEVASDNGPLRAMRVPANVRGMIFMSGAHLQLREQDLPDSLLLAAPGRRLGDVVDVQPVLNGRRIVEAGRADMYGRPALWFDLAPDLVPLAPLHRISDPQHVIDILSAGAPS